MRDNDGRQLDHKTLEQLRIRAVGQIEQGARRGVRRPGAGDDARGGVCVASQLPRRRAGRAAGKPVPVTAATPVGRAAWPAVRAGGRQRPTASEPSVGRLLRKLGLSPQRRLYRAWRQNPEAVARRKREEYPAIHAQAAKVGATIWFADEAGVRSDSHAGTTWAPVGRTPVVAITGARFGVNLISAVTAKGKLRFAAYDGNLNASVFLDFCRRLDDTSGPVFLVLDGHPVHRSGAVKAFAASTDGRLRLCFLPRYAPELNPDEWVWKSIKHDRIGRAGVTGPDDLKAKALARLHRLQRLLHLIKSFFRDPNLCYITA
jgi:transposase